MIFADGKIKTCHLGYVINNMIQLIFPLEKEKHIRGQPQI